MIFSDVRWLSFVLLLVDARWISWSCAQLQPQLQHLLLEGLEVPDELKRFILALRLGRIDCLESGAALADINVDTGPHGGDLGSKDVESHGKLSSSTTN